MRRSSSSFTTKAAAFSEMFCYLAISHIKRPIANVIHVRSLYSCWQNAINWHLTFLQRKYFSKTYVTENAIYLLNEDRWHLWIASLFVRRSKGIPHKKYFDRIRVISHWKDATRITELFLLHTWLKHNRQKVFCLSSTGKLILGADYVLVQLIPVATPFEALVCGRSLAGTAGNNPSGAWMSVSCERCVLSRRVLCFRLITRPE